MQARRDVFQAIADPTRRAMIGLLAGQTLTLNAVAEHFDISQPAVSKHIRILTECGLVVIVKQGRERHCTARLQTLQEVALWAEQYRAFWNSRLDTLEKLVNRQTKK
jgi:DNA-binding transcriptional ArsR family regulator